ncbi:MAG: Gfo/Idh/MocA family oxidoreductase, partial [Planctomycetes bacterium]|nr:Gfo/Idh/MocA family oxidoreductase [Planctomycetota bacterium]
MTSKEASRREFLRTASAGAAAFTLAASSRARVLGANDRISIGIIGCGDRGRQAHMRGVQKHAKTQNIEITAVCDPWTVAREKAAAMAEEWYGRRARTFGTYRDVVALRDIDAVMIASCDHQHTTHLEAAARAKKDIYVEKPLAMTIESLKDACDAVVANGCIVQVGTQLRSYPSFTGVRKLFQTGILGGISRIEQCRNGSRPYWYAYLKDAKEEDVDWREFLMDRPMRPFRADLFTGWYGYRDFSGGPVPGLASHFIDLVHYITGARFPASAVAQGGTFIWRDEHGFTCPDQIQATWVYPEGFLVSYSTNFGNGSGNSFKVFGTKGVLDLADWNKPIVSGEGAFAKGELGERKPVEPVERPEHFL